MQNQSQHSLTPAASVYPVQATTLQALPLVQYQSGTNCTFDTAPLSCTQLSELLASSEDFDWLVFAVAVFELYVLKILFGLLLGLCRRRRCGTFSRYAKGSNQNVSNKDNNLWPFSTASTTTAASPCQATVINATSAPASQHSPHSNCLSDNLSSTSTRTPGTPCPPFFLDAVEPVWKTSWVASLYSHISATPSDEDVDSVTSGICSPIPSTPSIQTSEDVKESQSNEQCEEVLVEPFTEQATLETGFFCAPPVESNSFGVSGAVRQCQPVCKLPHTGRELVKLPIGQESSTSLSAPSTCVSLSKLKPLRRRSYCSSGEAISEDRKNEDNSSVLSTIDVNLPGTCGASSGRQQSAKVEKKRSGAPDWRAAVLAERAASSELSSASSSSSVNTSADVAMSPQALSGISASTKRADRLKGKTKRGYSAVPNWKEEALAAKNFFEHASSGD